MELVLKRIWRREKFTIGILYINNSAYCFTLEDPVRDTKVMHDTAIPAGVYSVTIDKSQRFGRDMPHLLGVHGFEGIRIHAGNTTADTSGCPLLGLAADMQAGTISKSVAAFDPFFALLRAAVGAKESVFIAVENP